MSKRIDIELLKGAVDIHVHNGPSLMARHEAIDIVRNARDMGLRGMVLKNHHLFTFDRAYFLKQLVPGIDIFSGLTLNYCFGGLNPFAVDIAIRFGAKEIWMPTIDAYHQKVVYGSLGGYGKFQSPGKSFIYEKVEGIRIWDENKKLLPELKDIFQLIKEANIILAVGHLDLEEINIFVKKASEFGVKKIVVDHPNGINLRMPIKMQKELVENGAKMNYVFSSISPKWWSISISDYVKNIYELGVENVVLSSDLGQLHNPLPAEGLRILVQLLIEEGVEANDIKKMLVENPSFLLYD